MTKNTRLFLWCVGGALVLALATGLVASYAGVFGTAAAKSPGPAELGFVPMDAQLVAYADVRELVHSEFHRRWIGEHRAPTGLDGLLGQLGLDPETDIDSVLVTVSASPAGSGREDVLVLVRGRFDETRIEHAVRERGGRASDYQGTRLVRYAGPDQNEAAVAFLEPGLLGLGSTAVVRQAVDLAAGDLSLTANDEVMSLVRSVAAGHLWAVGRFGALASRARLPLDPVGGLPTLGWFSASGRVTDGLEGVIRVDAEDAESAGNLRDVVQGFVALARVQAGATPGLTKVVNSLQLTTQGRAVTLSFAVPADAVSALGAQGTPTPRPPAGPSGDSLATPTP
jgi:hypothetical protein